MAVKPVVMAVAVAGPEVKKVKEAEDKQVAQERPELSSGLKRIF